MIRAILTASVLAVAFVLTEGEAFFETAQAEAASSDLLGVAAVITAVGVAFASIVSALTLAVANRTAVKVTQIDRAVNGQAPETAPMVEQVQDIHAQIDPAELDRQALLPLVRRLVALAEAAAHPQVPPPAEDTP